jgi:hypothetical protein
MFGKLVGLATAALLVSIILAPITGDTMLILGIAVIATPSLLVMALILRAKAGAKAGDLLMVVYFENTTKRYRNELMRRAQHTEIGLSGHVSLLDKSFAERNNLKSLNRIEKWILRDMIRQERQRHWENWRATLIEQIGEDPGEFQP